MATSNPTASGVIFGPTNSGKMYLSTFKHRGTGSPVYKSVWSPAVPPQMEYAIFALADDGNWQCSSGHYWGIHIHTDDRPMELGKDGERLCKFPRTANGSDPWHGYPVFSNEDAPPDEFVEQWRISGVINRIIAKRIQKGKL